MRNNQTVFQHGCTISHSQLQRMRVPVVLPLTRIWYWQGFVFFTLAILISTQCYYNMVFIYTFLVANDVEHLLYAHLHQYLLWWNMYSNFCPSKKWVVSFLIVLRCYQFWIHIFVRYVIINIFFPDCVIFSFS